MGWLKLIRNVNNPEGIREAMRMAYKRHRSVANQGEVTLDDMTSPHMFGLYGALASRWKSFYGVDPPESLVWTALAPFILMDDERGASELLAEYVVLKESAVDANIEAIKMILNRTITQRRLDAPDHPFLFAIALGGEEHAWYELLNNENQAFFLDLRERTQAGDPTVVDPDMELLEGVNQPAYCHSCAAESSENARFCSGCGARLRT